MVDSEEHPYPEYSDEEQQFKPKMPGALDHPNHGQVAGDADESGRRRFRRIEEARRLTAARRRGR